MSRFAGGGVALLAASLVSCGGAAVTPSAAHAAPAHAHHRSRRHASTHAPSGPPLLSGVSAGPSGEEGPEAGVVSDSGDQLVENGLSSPLCKGGIAGRLSAAAESDCRASGFVGASAPTDNYALDVHIDTGAFGLSKGGLLSVIQDVFIAPVWGALEWVVHSLLVMLEWCYTLELLGGGGTSAVAAALAQARAGFTDPWLALVLALASLLAMYHGLVRRRIADTLGGALAMLAMMTGGLWVIADPSGTVGAVGQWADQASLGTLAVAASGNPRSTAATLGDSMRALYAGAIEKPWCFLEFGNVHWCDEPSLLEPGLRAAALTLAAHEGGGHGAFATSKDLVRAAATNGALFLSFPANGPARNSINDEGSLLRAICRSKDATECKGPAAAEAEFRTDGGTMSRLLGLLPIAVGVLGMALLFGLLALRLLAAAFLSMLLLLLAPLAVLAPALGDGGRALFTTWFTRLLGAVTSKLLFSFVLGSLLTMQRMLFALGSLGWWTQWLLVSAFWWIVFFKRQEAAAVMRGAGASAGRTRPLPDAGARGGTPSGHWPHGGRLAHSLQTYGAIRHPKRWAQAQGNARIAPAGPKGDEDAGGSRLKLPLPGARRRKDPTTANEPGSIESDGATKTGASTESDLFTEPDISAVSDASTKTGGSAAFDSGYPAKQSVSPRSGKESGSASDLAFLTTTHKQRVAAKPNGGQAASAEAKDAVDPDSASASGRTESGGDRSARQRANPGVRRANGASATAESGRRDPLGRPTSPHARAGGGRAGSADAEDVGATAGPSIAVPDTDLSATSMPPGGDGVVGGGSPIMEDAHAVAERRKRQLGFERES